jgi:hypothetical protein
MVSVEGLKLTRLAISDRLSAPNFSLFSAAYEVETSKAAIKILTKLKTNFFMTDSLQGVHNDSVDGMIMGRDRLQMHLNGLIETRNIPPFSASNNGNRIVSINGSTNLLFQTFGFCQDNFHGCFISK